MLVFRCTKKLRSLLKVHEPPELPRSTTRLGDWYANTLFVGRLRLVIFISEATMLPVVIPLSDSKTLVPRFRQALTQMLDALGIPPEEVRREIDADGDPMFGPTASRQVVGVMNEMGYLAEAQIRSGDHGALLQLSLWLSRVPVGPLEHVFPDEAVRFRLASRRA